MFFRKKNKEKTFFIDYLYLVNGLKSYKDMNGVTRYQNEEVVVRYVPNINKYAVISSKGTEQPVIIADDNTDLSTITNDIYIVKKSDLNFSNYTNYDDLNIKRGNSLFQKIA